MADRSTFWKKSESGLPIPLTFTLNLEICSLTGHALSKRLEGRGGYGNSEKWTWLQTHKTMSPKSLEFPRENYVRNS